MNLRNYKHLILIVVLILVCSPAGFGQFKPQIQAKIDSVNLLMGNMTTLHLTVTQPKNLKGQIPLFDKIHDNGIIPVCGDSVEFRSPSKIDSTVNGDRLTINYEIPVQAFDSGFYKLPEILFIAGKDSVKSNSIGLRVYPVAAEADTPINDYASVADPENASWLDAIPDWLLDLWWLWILIILAIIAYLYAMKKYKKDGHILPRKPEPTPYEAAIDALYKLKEKKLWEQGLEKDYFTELTEILRVYLYRRFGINAMEMTSRQILVNLRANQEIADKREYFRQILNMADFVKFAKVRPLPDDNVKAYDNALRFVRETKPVETPQSESDGSQNGVKGVVKTIQSKQTTKKGGER